MTSVSEDSWVLPQMIVFSLALGFHRQLREKAIACPKSHSQLLKPQTLSSRVTPWMTAAIVDFEGKTALQASPGLV